eukprot:TRINITY_DN5159_c0_g1_i1.p1 TRINITY_DN5159_c0_g1~~TRINITY_DN5159_c0_g1_i1.p1  ORF type:complete len:323 (-),score=45.08 TRINITY_DN5159_c0_g1_i1:184-1152(-)
MLVATPNGGYPQLFGGPAPFHQANMLRTTHNSMPIQNAIVPNAGLSAGQNHVFTACCDPSAQPYAQHDILQSRTRAPATPWGRSLPSPPWNISIAPTPQRAQARRASQNRGRTSENRKNPVIEPEGLLCPITQVMFQDPCFVPESGNTYERTAIEQYWHTVPQPRDPLTNVTLSNTTLYSNWGMRREIQRFLEEHADYIPQGWSDRTVPPAAPSSVPAQAVQQQQQPQPQQPQQQQQQRQQRRRHSAERSAPTEDEQLQWAMRESLRPSRRSSRDSRRRARSAEAMLERAAQLGFRGTAAARAAMRAFADQVRRGLLAVRAA